MKAELIDSSIIRHKNHLWVLQNSDTFQFFSWGSPICVVCLSSEVIGKETTWGKNGDINIEICSENQLVNTIIQEALEQIHLDFGLLPGLFLRFGEISSFTTFLLTGVLLLNSLKVEGI